MRDRERVEEIRAYYEKILPFYEKESIARAHVEFWRGLARRWLPERVLELGSGLGYVTRALSCCAPAVGIDISFEMLRRASRRAPRRARFVAADMRGVVFGCRFDLVVAPNDPFCHLLDLGERRQALRAAARQLSKGGRLVIDGLYRTPGHLEISARKIRHAAGTLSISETWRPAGARQIWLARYSYRDRRAGRRDRTLEASFLARAWEPEEIRPLFESCGLAVEEIWGGFDGRPFDRSANRLLIVARRRARFVHHKRSGGRRS